MRGSHIVPFFVKKWSPTLSAEYGRIPTRTKERKKGGEKENRTSHLILIHTRITLALQLKYAPAASLLVLHTRTKMV